MRIFLALVTLAAIGVGVFFASTMNDVRKDMAACGDAKAFAQRIKDGSIPDCTR